MNRYVTYCLLLLFLLIVVTGCHLDREGEADGRTLLTYWVLFTGGDLEFMEAIVHDFNTSQDEIYVNMVLQDWDEYYTKLVTSVAANRGPDVAITHAAVLPELVNQGITIPLDELAEEVGLNWEAFNENILQAVHVDGAYHAIPIDTHPFIMYLNTDLANEAGLLDENGEPIMEHTPDGFRHFFMEAKEALPEYTPLSISTGGADPFRWWWTLYHQMGGTPIFSDDLRDPEITLDTEIAVEAAEYILSFFYEEELIPLHLADFYQHFQAGNAVAIMTGVWATGIWESTDALNFTPVPLPTIFGEDAAQGDSHTLFLPINDDSTPETLQAGITFMDFVADQGASWAEAGHIPSKTSVIESDEFQSLPHRSDYAQVADRVVFPDTTIYHNPSETVMTRNLDEIWSGRETAQEAIENMIHELDVLIH